MIDTHPFKVGPLTVNDGEHGHPSLTVSQIIQKSSNVGTVKISQKLDATAPWASCTRDLGFGQKPQIGFPGAATGRLRPWKSWLPVEKATMAYGYGLSASLLQIARAYTAIARDGEMAPLTLIKGGEPLPGARIFKPETARTMRQMMRGTVSKDGTAPLAQPVGYSAGGKTGTASQAGRPRLQQQQAPRLVHRLRADRQPARGGGRDGRRTHRRLLRRPGGRTGVQGGGRAGPAHAGRAARPRGPPQVVAQAGGNGTAATDCNPDSPAAMPLTRLKNPQAAARWLTSWVTGVLRTDSRQVQPGDAFIAWPGYATDGRQYVARPRWLPVRPPAWSRKRA